MDELKASRPATMKDIAAAVGVSIATVSRALSGDPAISAQRTAAVIEASRRLQYRPSAAARKLRTKSSMLIGVVVQSLGDSYVGEVAFGIQSKARALGFQPLFFTSEGREDLENEALEVFLSEQVSEFIAVSPKGKPRLLRQAMAEGLHVSVINWDVGVPESLFASLQSGEITRRITRFDAEVFHDSVREIRFDDVGAARLATRHLLGLGHRQFIHLRGPNVRSSLLRLLGFRLALEEAGLWPQPVLTAASPVLASREGAISEYLRRARPPLAVVAYDDLCAVAALRAAHEAGWRVPAAMSVVGIDDIQFAAYTNPGLTTVAQPKAELGALAVEALLGERRREPHVPLGPGVAVLPGMLVTRESTAPARRHRGAPPRPTVGPPTIGPPTIGPPTKGPPTMGLPEIGAPTGGPLEMGPSEMEPRA